MYLGKEKQKNKNRTGLSSAHVEVIITRTRETLTTVQTDIYLPHSRGGGGDSLRIRRSVRLGILIIIIINKKTRLPEAELLLDFVIVSLNRLSQTEMKQKQTKKESVAEKNETFLTQMFDSRKKALKNRRLSLTVRT